MAINRLQFSDAAPMPQPDFFRPLNAIGEAIAGGRTKQAIADVLTASTGPNGKLDPGMAGAALSKIGLTDEARPFLALAQQQAALGQSAASHAETARHNKAIEDLARAQYENPKETIQHAFNPATGQNEFYGVRPGQPVRVMTPAAAAPAPAEPAAAPAAASPAPAAAAPAPAAPPVAAAPAMEPHWNAAALEGTSPAIAELIRKVARYEVNPASLETKGGQRTFILSRASQLDPTFDQTFYPTKQRTLGAFSAGPEGRTLRAVNNLTDHLDTAEELVKALGNKDPQLINSITNKIKTQFGYTPPSNMAAAAPIIGGEITKVIAGIGAGGVQERAEAAAIALSQAKNEKQALEAIGVIKKLMGGQVKGLEQQYEAGTRLKDFRARLSPGARKIIEPAEEKPAAALPKVTTAEEANAARRDAAAAIAKGADPVKVNEVLRKLLEP